MVDTPVTAPMLKAPNGAAPGVSTRQAFGAPAVGETEARASPFPRPGVLPPGEGKWPLWKTAVFVLGFCGAFWAGVAWIVYRLLM